MKQNKMSLPKAEDIIHESDMPVIISAYTIQSHLGNYYQKATVRLSKSCIKHNLQHIIYPLKSVDNWVKGCNLKPTIILQALKTFQKPVLWIDADGEIIQYPKIFRNPNFQMALCKEGGHWLSGTLYFRPAAQEFVEKWLSSMKSNEPDEITLLHTYSNSKKQPKLKFLPPEYNQVVHKDTDKNKIIIGHYIRPDVAPSRNLKSIEIEEIQ